MCRNFIRDRSIVSINRTKSCKGTLYPIEKGFLGAFDPASLLPEGYESDDEDYVSAEDEQTMIHTQTLTTWIPMVEAEFR